MDTPITAIDAIVTYNLDDFPAATLAPYAIQAQHPDEIIAHLLEIAPAGVAAAAKSQREGLKNPPRSVDEFLATLELQGLVRSVAALRQCSELI